MGLCCSLCFKDNFFALQVGEITCRELQKLFSKIEWTDSIWSTVYVNTIDVKKIIAVEVVKAIKLNNISVLSLDGFVQEYIGIQIAGLIFKHALYKTLTYPSLINDCNEEIPIEYKDVFASSSVDKYYQYLTDNNYTTKFIEQYKTNNNLNNINLCEQAPKDALRTLLSNYILNTVKETIEQTTNLNVVKYLRCINRKKEIYDNQVNKILDGET